MHPEGLPRGTAPDALREAREKLVAVFLWGDRATAGEVRAAIAELERAVRTALGAAALGAGIMAHMPSRERLRDMIAAAPDLDCEAGAAAPPDTLPLCDPNCEHCETWRKEAEDLGVVAKFHELRAAAPSRPEGDSDDADDAAHWREMLDVFERSSGFDAEMAIRTVKARIQARKRAAASAPEREPQ